MQIISKMKPRFFGEMMGSVDATKFVPADYDL